MLTIRPAEEKDAPHLAAAEAEVARTPGLLVSRPHELKAEAFSRTIAELRNTGLYVVAEEAGLAVGHAFLAPMSLDAIAHVFRLTIVVHPGQEARGTGTALMRHLLAWARENEHVGKIELQVRATNERAIRLYRRMGFVPEGVHRRRIRLEDGSFVDDLLMAWFPDSPDGG
jgi:RimJ/RimL family protein N-acetyltransferase